MNRLLSAAIILIAASSSILLRVTAQPLSPEEIVRLYNKADVACRGSDDAIEACAARSGFADWLHTAGWCERVKGHEFEDVADWHKCAGNE